MEINVTADNFEEEVIKSDIPVLVDFWATWCGPCMMLAPVIEEISDEYDGKVKVCKVNVDEAQELAIGFGVSSIPTLMVFKDGEVLTSAVGYLQKEKVTALLENL